MVSKIHTKTRTILIMTSLLFLVFTSLIFSVPGAWLPMGENICYGPKDSAYWKFKFDRNCKLFAVRLRHASGGFLQRGRSVTTRWGKNEWFWTVVTNQSHLMFPKELHKNSYYNKDTFPGFEFDDPLIFHNQKTPTKVHKDDVYRVWFAPEFKDDRVHENYYDGVHCVDVDVSCLV